MEDKSKEEDKEVGDKKIPKKFNNIKLRYLILGLTFKENCVDFRNSQSIELVKKLKNKNIETHCYDPIIDINDFNKKNLFKINKFIRSNYYHCCIVSVAHNYFKNLGEKILVGRYHSWILKKKLPSCLEVTCVDEKNEIMAIKHKKFDVKGVQFHPESVLTPKGKIILKNWISS